MADFQLTASPALAEPPLEIGGTRLAPHDPGAVTTLVLRAADPEALNADIARMLGCALPEIGRSATLSDGRALLRPSRERAYLVGPGSVPPGTDGFIALDQTDFWAVCTLDGPGARVVLERSWSPDLDDSAFPPGAVAQSPLAQVTTMLHRVSAQSYHLYAPRSYAGSFYHELQTSLRWVL